MPVTVATYCPMLAVVEAVKVRVVPLAEELGERDAVTPLGKPETAKRTVPLNPKAGSTEILAVVEVPWPRLMLPGFHSEKLGAAMVTTRGVEAD